MPDVNGSKFHLLLSREDWLATRPGSDPNPMVSGGDQPNLEWSTETGLRLRRRIDFVRPDLAEVDLLTYEDRRGADRDRYGTWWTVGPDSTTIVAHRDGSPSRAWPTSTEKPDALFQAKSPLPEIEHRFGGLVVTDDHRLVVGVLDQPGLLVFDLVSGGDPIFLRWTETEDFSPIDLARRPGGGLYILDSEPGTAGPAWVWELDRQLGPAVTKEVPADAVLFVEPAEKGAAAPPKRVAVPWELSPGRITAIEAVPDADKPGIAVLDEQGVHGAVHWYDYREGLPRTSLDLATALTKVVTGGDVFILGHDIAVTETDGGWPRLHVDDRSGRQVFAFDMTDDGFVARADNLPLRRHSGRAVVAWCGEVWFDGEDEWFPLLARGRPRYDGSGTLVTAVFDGSERGCVWHRVYLDGCIPVATSVVIESRAADDPAELPSTPWRTDPAPYMRWGGTELPIDSDVAPSEQGRTGTWETLLQRANGRYCQLRLTLSGNGGATPRLFALRLVYPRFSYVDRYLPATFRERDRSTRFLERYLANPEGLLTDIEERIVNAHALFDHRSVPDEYLDWLVSWLGTTFDDDLSPDRRRIFLANAVDLFRSRGTVPGLIRSLLLVLSECPEDAFEPSAVSDPFGIRVLESYSTRRLGVPIPDGPGEVGETTVMDPADRWKPDLGAAELHERFRRYLDRRYGADWPASDGWVSLHSSRSSVRVRPTVPSNTEEAADWQVFLARQLGLQEVAFDQTHLEVYRRYLLQRYRRIERYGTAHQHFPPPQSFGEVALPTTLPADGPALDDWHAVMTLAIPIAAAAHRFDVLLPIDIDDPPQEQARLVQLARRVVDRERPAHTSFGVRPYWAAFQLGDARLGIETRLGRSSRTGALVLGQDELATAHLVGPPTRAGLGCEVCP